MQAKMLKELKKGDIIRMRIPFEENTRDYYNGYRPQEIRGGLYIDKNGQTSKTRYVIVIGHDDNAVQYLPLTSRHSRFDSQHQYELTDNSMTPKRDPDMKSYVEVDSLRSVYANPKWELQHYGRITENDMTNIMVRLGRRSIDFESDRDQRAYVSRNKEETFDEHIKAEGYSLTDADMERQTYKKADGRTITKTRWGLVKYHVPLSKEEVTALIAKHEGRPVEYYEETQAGKPVDDFSRAVADITENKVMEREAAK